MQQQQNQQVMFWVLLRLATTTESNINFALWNFKGISPLENIQTRPKTTRVATTPAPLRFTTCLHVLRNRFAQLIATLCAAAEFNTDFALDW